MLRSLIAVLAACGSHAAPRAAPPPPQPSRCPPATAEVFGGDQRLLERAGLHPLGNPRLDEQKGWQEIPRKLKAAGDLREVNVFFWDDPCDQQDIVIDVVPNSAPPAPPYRAEPTGDVPVPAVFHELYDRYGDAFSEAISDASGNVGEEYVQGRILNKHPALRAVEMKYLPIVGQHVEVLLRAAREDRDPRHRSDALLALAYTDTPERVVATMIEALDDPSVGVRNEAARELTPVVRILRCRQPGFSIPVDPVLRMFSRANVLDRQKAASLLEVLADDPAIAKRIRDEAGPRLRAVGNTKLYMHRRMIYPLIRYVLRDPPLGRDELAAWVREHHPEDVKWFDHFIDQRRIDDPCGELGIPRP